MKFQNRSIHGSKVNRRTDRQTDKPKAICPSNFFKVGGIKMYYSNKMKELRVDNTLHNIWSTLCTVEVIEA